MKRSTWLLIATLAIMVVSLSGFAPAQDSPAQVNIIRPPSTLGTIPGVKVRTDLELVKPEGLFPANSPPPNAENPESIACIYGVTPPTSGCPRTGAPLASGGTKAIAVVDYGHDPNLQANFNAFNTQYGLPAQTLQFICDCSSCPNNDGTGWDLETALDVEYSHAMAPNAQIIVSQFCSDPFAGGTSAAEYLAGQAVAALGGGEVSNSFDYNGEFSGELAYDQYMTTPGVVYFASAGDGGCQTNYPAASPNAIGAGGTHIVRNSGLYQGQQTCWTDSGGGISAYEALPNYQLIIGNRTGPHRGTPDYAADADPNTGVAVYSSTGCGGWCQVGGTSVSSPVLAGIVNAAGSFANHSPNELGKSYGYYRTPGQYRAYFNDVNSGSNGGSCGAAKVGWDECTGLGAPINLAGF